MSNTSVQPPSLNLAIFNHAAGNKFLRRDGSTVRYVDHHPNSPYTAIYSFVNHKKQDVAYNQDGLLVTNYDRTRDIIERLDKPMSLSFVKVGDVCHTRNGDNLTCTARDGDKITLTCDEGDFTYRLNGEYDAADNPEADIMSITAAAEQPAPQDPIAAAIDRLTALLMERLERAFGPDGYMARGAGGGGGTGAGDMQGTIRVRDGETVVMPGGGSGDMPSVNGQVWWKEDRVQCVGYEWYRSGFGWRGGPWGGDGKLRKNVTDVRYTEPPEWDRGIHPSNSWAKPPEGQHIGPVNVLGGGGSGPKPVINPQTSDGSGAGAASVTVQPDEWAKIVDERKRLDDIRKLLTAGCNIGEIHDIAFGEPL